MSSSSNLEVGFNNALQAYERQTNIYLFAHPLAAQLQSCDTPSATLALLQEQVRDGDDIWTRWLDPTVKVLDSLSMALGERVNLVISPAKLIFTGVGVLLSTAKDAPTIQGSFVEVFERIGFFFRRLETYINVPLTTDMMDMVIGIMVEVLSILAIATKGIKVGRMKNFTKWLVGRTDMEDALKRLDKLTQEEARKAAVQLLKTTHAVKYTEEGVVDTVVHANDRVAKVNKTVVGVESRVMSGDGRVLSVGERVKTIDKDTGTQMQESLFKWLSPPDPLVNHKIACNARQEGTSNWFLRSKTFEEWNSEGSLLWIHGKPGSGKSVLCSAIIEDIKVMHRARLASIAYFYFDFKDIHKQTHRDAISSLLFQLSDQSDDCRNILHRLYSVHNSGAQMPSDGILAGCLKDMLSPPSRLSEAPMYIIMDAIDECPNTSATPSPREEILDLIEGLIGLSPNLRLCVTSRSEIDIQVVLKPLLPSRFRVSLHDESGQKQDIADYIRAFVYSDRKMRRWKEEDKELVIKVLTERADGMFRWAYCQLEFLRHCLPPSIRRVLDELPKTLDETYERILMEISKEKRVYARRLLQCLAVAIRPLHIKELAEVFVFNIDTEGAIPELVTGFRPADPEGAVLSACSSLVTIDGSMLVQLSHASVKEFLTSDRLTRSSGRLSYYHFSFEPAHLTLAQACLGVLLQLEDHLDRRDSIEKFPLAAYAAEHWVDHARFNNVASLIQEGMELLFDPAKPHFANWVRIYDMDQPLRSPTPHAIRSNATPLYYAALCGIPSLVERLIVERHMDVNARGGHYGTAIQAALYKGHLSIVRLLIEHNADVNSKDDDGSSPLHMAAQIGDHEAVSFLLSYRTDVQATDSGHSLVFSALNSGNVAVTRLHGADTNARDEMDLTSLHIPSNNGDFEHIRVLLERAADVNSQDNQGSTPLHLASAKGNDSVVRLLIEHRAEVNALDNTNSTPLHLASLNGNSDVVVLLIEYGAIVDARDSKNSTPLHLASAKGDDKVVKLLIEHGAYVNAKGEKGMTPLHAASRRGPFDVVKLLLEYGAEPNARNDDVQTPLHIASQEGVIDVVQCLLTARADANVQDRDGKTPRDLASINKKSEVVQLLTKPARPTVRDNRRQMSFKLQAVGSPQQAVGSPRSPRV